LMGLPASKPSDVVSTLDARQISPMGLDCRRQLSRLDSGIEKLPASCRCCAAVHHVIVVSVAIAVFMAHGKQRACTSKAPQPVARTLLLTTVSGLLYLNLSSQRTRTPPMEMQCFAND
jgi:hypothetical protein